AAFRASDDLDSTAVGTNAIAARSRRDVQGSTVLVAPGEVGGLLRKQNPTKKRTVRAVDPHVAWSGAEDRSFLGQLHPVRRSPVRRLHVRENPIVRQVAIGSNVERAD